MHEDARRDETNLVRRWNRETDNGSTTIGGLNTAVVTEVCNRVLYMDSVNSRGSQRTAFS